MNLHGLVDEWMDGGTRTLTSVTVGWLEAEPSCTDASAAIVYVLSLHLHRTLMHEDLQSEWERQVPRFYYES